MIRWNDTDTTIHDDADTNVIVDLIMSQPLLQDAVQEEEIGGETVWIVRNGGGNVVV